MQMHYLRKTLIQTCGMACMNETFIISEEEQHALVSPEQRRYGSKDLRNSYCASLTRTLPQGSVLMESIRRETLI